MAFKKYPTVKELQKDLKQKKMHHSYLMLGEEEGEKDKYIGFMGKILIPDEEERRTATGRFHLESEPLLDAADFALSSSMFSSKRMCIIRNLDQMKSTKANREIFTEMMKNLPESTTLIMTTEKNRPPDFITSKMQEKLFIVQFWRHFDADIFRYLQGTLQKKGINMEEKAINILITRTGRDIKKIDEAVDMIYYSGLEGTITTQTVEDYITDVKDITIYEFIDALFMKKNTTLPLFKKLHEDGVPEGRIFYEINKTVDQLEKYYFLAGSGSSIDEALKGCGILPRNRDKFLSFSRSYPEVEIKRLFPLLGKAEIDRRGNTSSKKLISSSLFELVSRMTGR